MNRFNKSQLNLNYNDIDFFNKEFVMWRRFIHFKNNVFYYNSNTKKYQLEKPEYDFVEYKVNKNGNVNIVIHPFSKIIRCKTCLQ